MKESTSAVTVMGTATLLVVPVAKLAVEVPYVSASAVANGRFAAQVLCTGDSVRVRLAFFGAVDSKSVSVAESAPPLVGMLQAVRSNWR